MKVAVIGHSELNIAPGVAAELALRGLDVAWWPAPAAIRASGGLQVRHASLLGPWQDGPVRLRTPATAAVALEGVSAVVIDIPARRLLPEVQELADSIPAGAVVHVQSHGYWPAMRLATAFGSRGWILSDSSGPTHAAGLQGDALNLHARRRNLRFSSIGGDALPGLRLLYGETEPAASALETGLEGLNLMVHPGATLANLGALDRAAAAGQGFGFYAEGNTASAARLAEALDVERGAACQAWGVRHKPVREALATIYGAAGETLQQAITQCPFYAGLGSLPATAPRRWAETDLPFALVPLIRLAEARAVPVPLHRAAVSVLSTAFGLDPWTEAPTLHHLGANP